MSSPSCRLKKIQFSEGELSPAFAPDTYSYELSLPSQVVQVSMSVEPEDPQARVFVMPGDEDSKSEGYQVETDTLQAMGVQITVTATNGDAAEYQVFSTPPS